MKEQYALAMKRSGHPGAGQESPRNESVPIGFRLRDARLASRRTVTEVARDSGLTKSFLSKLERDQVSASVASLIRLCGVLNISVASLFQAHEGALVRRHEYPRINFGGDKLTEYLLTPRAEQRLQAVLSEIEPGGGSGDELYSLPAEIEFVLILAGRLLIQLETRELLLEKGDALTFSAKTRHTFHNPDKRTVARVLWLFAPALPSPLTESTEQTS